MNSSNSMEPSLHEARVNHYNGNLMNNYHKMVSLTDPFIKRSYEDCKWYQIVCNPFDRQYVKYKNWYESGKFINSVINSLKKYCKNSDPAGTDMFVVKEQMGCAKHHVNVLIASNYDLSVLHNKNTNKFKWYTVQLYDLSDRRNVRDYMIKESKIRNLRELDDYAYTFIDSENDFVDVEFLDAWFKDLAKGPVSRCSEAKEKAERAS